MAVLNRDSHQDFFKFILEILVDYAIIKTCETYSAFTEGNQMNIRDFVDVAKLEEILKSWSKATGMAVAILDDKGEYFTEKIGYTDFCTKYTRGSEEGAKRCLKCDQRGRDTYSCHAGLMDFSREIRVDNVYFGKIIGGQILPEEPDEDKYRSMADELGIKPDAYVKALSKVSVSSEKTIRAGVDLLSETVNMLVTEAYQSYHKQHADNRMNEDIEKVATYINNISTYTKNLNKLEKNQTILALNAAIEAARAGEAGRGFAIVANKVASLASEFGECNHQIEEEMKRLTEIVKGIAGQK